MADNIIKPIPDGVEATLDFAAKFGRRMCWPPSELACDWDRMTKPLKIEADEQKDESQSDEQPG